MKKNTIRLTESQIREMVTESVNRILREYDEEGAVVPIAHQKFKNTWDLACAIRDVMNSEPKAESWKEAYMQLHTFLGEVYDYIFEIATRK